jgi:hypothetical protein
MRIFLASEADVSAEAGWISSRFILEWRDVGGEAAPEVRGTRSPSVFLEMRLNLDVAIEFGRSLCECLLQAFHGAVKMSVSRDEVFVTLAGWKFNQLIPGIVHMFAECLETGLEVASAAKRPQIDPAGHGIERKSSGSDFFAGELAEVVRVSLQQTFGRRPSMRRRSEPGRRGIKDPNHSRDRRWILRGSPGLFGVLTRKRITR